MSGHSALLREGDHGISLHVPTTNVALPKTRHDIHTAGENLGLKVVSTHAGRQLEFPCPVCRGAGRQGTVAVRQVERDLFIRCDGCCEPHEILWQLAGMQDAAEQAGGAL